MRRARLRSTGGSLLLALSGALALAATLPRISLSGTLPACITESSGTAWLGLHLHLLSQSAICPEGMFAPGPYYAEIARFSIVLSLSTLVAGVAMLTSALGLGLWARVALRRARTWLRQRLGLARVPALVGFHRAPVLVPVTAGYRGAAWADSRLLRGPPAVVLG
jgi:hypothetical protein